MKLKNIYLLLIAFLLASCTQDDEPVSSIQFNLIYEVENDRVLLDASLSTSEDSDKLNYTWESEDDRIFIHNKNNAKAHFILPDSDTKNTLTIQLGINDGYTQEKLDQQIDLPAFNDHLKEWGLGKIAKNRKSNNVDYDWYIDQKNTGIHSANNCGPSCVTMVLKWLNQNFDKSVEYARSQYEPNGGWWYTNHITSYLLDNNANNRIIPLNTADDLKQELNDGNVAIVCLDMHLIQNEKDAGHRVDKFYSTSPNWGHFLVVKGFRDVDDECYFEVYDPNSWGNMYSDNSLKGMNRYYRADDILKSTNTWWSYAIIVSKTARKAKQGIDPNAIEHAWGR
ncbi:MAG: C39 family peptidase [Marinifilum sp.]|jgi:hypothetical protein|nr:C39 family peptidase [Marinifilum sp.]